MNVSPSFTHCFTMFYPFFTEKTSAVSHHLAARERAQRLGLFVGPSALTREDGQGAAEHLRQVLRCTGGCHGCHGCHVCGEGRPMAWCQGRGDHWWLGCLTTRFLWWMRVFYVFCLGCLMVKCDSLWLLLVNHDWWWLLMMAHDGSWRLGWLMNPWLITVKHYWLTIVYAD